MTDATRERIIELGLNPEDFEPKTVSQMDVIEAQVLYTALLTDTLIEE